MPKEELRKHITWMRSQLTAEQIQQTSCIISRTLFSMEYVIHADTIMSYVNMTGEVDTKRIIQKLLDQEKNVAVPVCLPKERELLVSKICSLQDLQVGHYGVLEPADHRIKPINAQELDLVITPGLAFDYSGGRIGFGAGYYDRFFAGLNPAALKIALAFDFQIFDSVPTSSYDVPVDYIITESGIIKSKK
jgi:5-formyltetrahydrofolate cyclo-ligase